MDRTPDVEMHAVSSFDPHEPMQPQVPPCKFEDEVAARLHEVAVAAREVPAELQPERLRDALTALVALEVESTGMTTVPELEQPA